MHIYVEHSVHMYIILPLHDHDRFRWILMNKAVLLNYINKCQLHLLTCLKCEHLTAVLVYWPAHWAPSKPSSHEHEHALRSKSPPFSQCAAQSKTSHNNEWPEYGVSATRILSPWTRIWSHWTRIWSHWTATIMIKAHSSINCYITRCRRCH